MKPFVMLPTYNEKGNLARIVRDILSQDELLKIVIVDDDSPDGTGAIADELVKDYTGRVYVLHRKKRGRGTAGVAGFKKALSLGASCIIEMDADFSHKPSDIPMLLDGVKDYDVVVGSRYVPGGRFVKCKRLNIIISQIANVFNRLVLGLDVKDTSGGFKCYRREVLEGIDLDNFVSWGYCIGPELLFKIHRAGFSMVEVPIVFENRLVGESKASMRVKVEYPLTVLKIRLSSLF